MKKSYLLLSFLLTLQVAKSQNIGIGTTTPQAKLSVGANSQFRVDSAGNITRVNNQPISFPSIQGANQQVLVNNGTGNLSWSSGLIPSGGIITTTALDTNLANLGFTLIGMKSDTIQPYTAFSAFWGNTLNTTGAPTARREMTMIWTGAEIILWGGASGSATYNTGFKYNPSTNVWTAISTINAPSARTSHVAVWTGTEMIIWSGVNIGTSVQYNNGGKYNPSTNTWTTISTVGAPSSRTQSNGVWTGTEMIVWGGGGSGYKNDGGRYNPATNTWTSLNTTNAPAARANHTAIWTGTEMIIWGGYNTTSTYNDGGRFNPTTNTWNSNVTTINAPLARAGHTSVWTGTDLIVWSGDAASSGTTGPYYNDGKIYNPSSNSWSNNLPTLNSPAARYMSAAVWTGTEMIIWGGNNGSVDLGDGKRLAISGGSSFGAKTAVTYYYYRKN